MRRSIHWAFTPPLLHLRMPRQWKASSLSSSALFSSASIKRKASDRSSSSLSSLPSTPSPPPKVEKGKSSPYFDYINDWNSKYRIYVNHVSNFIVHNPTLRNPKVNLNIWRNMVNAFRRRVIKSPQEALSKGDLLLFCEAMNGLPSSSPIHEEDAIIDTSELPIEVKEAMNTCSTLFMKYIQRDIDAVLGKDEEVFHKLCNISDLRLPHQIYAHTRFITPKSSFLPSCLKFYNDVDL